MAQSRLQSIAKSLASSLGINPGDDAVEAVDKAYQGNRKSVSPTQTAGRGGATAYGGYLVTREKSASLQGRQRYVTFSEMLANTSIVATGVRYFLNILSKQKWSVAPAQGLDGQPKPGAQEVADFVESCMCEMTTPWSKVVRRAGMYHFFGFSLQEWTAIRREDGKLGMKDVEPRPQSTIERWDLDEGGTVLGAWQIPELSATELYLPRKKLIHIVDDSLNDSPEGLGVLRHAVRNAERLKAYEELEEIAFETDLRGIPIGRAPLAAIRDAEKAGKIKASEVSKLLSPIENFLKNHVRNRKTGMLLDSTTYTTDDERQAPSNVKQWDMELLQGSSTAQEAVAKAIHRITRELALVLGTEHLLLGSDGSGSLALGNVKVADFYMVVGSVLGDIVEAYNRDYIAPLMLLNGIPKDLWPKFATEDVQFKDIETMAAALRDLATAGGVLSPDDPAINEMRELLGLSAVPKEIMERTIQEGALRTGAELDAMEAKADALRNPKAGAEKPVKSGEAGSK